LMVELGRILGKKPSPGQVYPLLRKLEQKGLVKHTTVAEGKRRLKVYTLTPKGSRACLELVHRFSDIVSIVLEPKISKCAHCGCKIYEGGHSERVGKRVLMFCCAHCARTYRWRLCRQRSGVCRKW
jgi:DNA-binding MarR family transcriptional regulator